MNDDIEDDQFLRIKVKRQYYLGKKSTVIFFSDFTKKVIGMVKEAQLRESVMQTQQAEIYTATISHEMRTPLGSALFFLRMIVQVL